MTTPTDTPISSARDPKAPYGRFANGKPRKTPPTSTAKTSTGSGTKRSAPKAPDFRPGIAGIFQAVCIPLAFAAPADAEAVSAYAPGIAEALNDLAKIRPEVAATLQRVLEAGPYGALIAAVLPLGIQLAHNHDLIPPTIAVRLGATPKDVILNGLRQQAEQMATAPADPYPGAAEDATVAQDILRDQVNTMTAGV